MSVQGLEEFYNIKDVLIFRYISNAQVEINYLYKEFRRIICLQRSAAQAQHHFHLYLLPLSKSSL